MRHQEAPRLPEVLGYSAGAISAFTILALVGRGARYGEATLGGDERIVAGTLH